jgi:hypothetical protein
MDQTIRLTGALTKLTYPEALRCVGYRDPVTGKRFRFLTNNFLLPALTIAQLYQARWNIEVFFKWIKQHLHIKSFYGNSENAIKTQIWIAISVYLLAAYSGKSWEFVSASTLSFRFLAWRFSKKAPFCRCSTHSTTAPNNDPNQLNLFHF